MDSKSDEARARADSAAPTSPPNEQYEDDLPADMTDAEYAEWFKQSRVDGVRIGPKVRGAAPTSTPGKLAEMLRLFRLPVAVAASRMPWEPDWPLDRLMCAAADALVMAERPRAAEAEVAAPTSTPLDALIAKRREPYLRRLIAKWRDQARLSNISGVSACARMRQCADELEAALAASPASALVPPKRQEWGMPVTRTGKEWMEGEASALVAPRKDKT